MPRMGTGVMPVCFWLNPLPLFIQKPGNFGAASVAFTQNLLSLVFEYHVSHLLQEYWRFNGGNFGFCSFWPKSEPPELGKPVVSALIRPVEASEMGLKTYHECATAGRVGAFFSRRMPQITFGGALVTPRIRQVLFGGASVTPGMDHHAHQDGDPGF